MKNRLILSIFPSIDILGKGFEENGFYVAQAQDKILGGEIRRFSPPAKDELCGSHCLHLNGRWWVK